MSRLDSFIRRLVAQRSCIERAAGLICDTPGAVFELGLGNGRTYDHIREVLPDRAVYVFERTPAPHPLCLPPPGYLIAGDFSETLPDVAARLGTHAAFIHADTGSGDDAANARLATWLGPLILPALARGGIVASDQPLTVAGLVPLEAPAEAGGGRYHLYRAAA